MFDYISGKVAAVGENRVVLDCGGVGFALTASAFTCEQCSRKAEARLPVYLAVRDDALELYGFGNERERELFLLLIGVSGVGPKAAISLLGGLNADRLASAIANGQTVALSAIKGIGKKTAERIVLELKGKIGGAEGLAAAVEQGTAEAVTDKRAVEALVNLGYDKKEAEAAVAQAGKPGMTTEQIVFAVLHG